MERLLQSLKLKSYELRKTVLEMCLKAGTGHVTSSMSCAEILVTLYYTNILKHDPKNPQWDHRDRLILSKGQASPILYALLADLGFFDREKLQHFAQINGSFGVHLQDNVPGVEITAGALGHGLGVAAGLALGAKMRRDLHTTFVILGDGELYEGSIWESAMLASHHKLNNLVGIIDRNFLCTTDFTENLISLEPLEEKWKSFGWNVKTIDGHSVEEIYHSLKDIKSRKNDRQLMIIAETTKGEGIDCMTNIPLYHGVPPKDKEITLAIKQLEEKYQTILNQK